MFGCLTAFRRSTRSVLTRGGQLNALHAPQKGNVMKDSFGERLREMGIVSDKPERLDMDSVMADAKVRTTTGWVVVSIEGREYFYSWDGEGYEFDGTGSHIPPQGKGDADTV